MHEDIKCIHYFFFLVTPCIVCWRVPYDVCSARHTDSATTVTEMNCGRKAVTDSLICVGLFGKGEKGAGGTARPGGKGFRREGI